MVGWEPFLWNWTLPPANIVRGITETVGISEARDRVTTHTRPLEEQILFSDTANRQKAVWRLKVLTFPYLWSFEDGSYSLTSYAGHQWNEPETILISELLTKGAKRTERALTTETTEILDSLSKIKSGVRDVAVTSLDTVTISASLLVSRTKARTIADSATPLAPYTTISYETTSYETLSKEISDFVTFVKPTGAGKNITETVTIGEAVARLEKKVRLITQTSTIGETLTPIAGKVKELDETVFGPEDFVDSLVESAEAEHVKSLVESETIAEDILSELTKTRTLDETTPITDRLQGWAKGVPMQYEAPPPPDITNIIGGVRERLIRQPYRKEPRFIWDIENTVYAPLRILPFAHDINKVIEPIRPIMVSLSTLQSGLRVPDLNRGQASTPLQTLSRLNSISLPLRLPQEPKTFSSKLRLWGTPTQLALEPRKIINIERKYRTLKAYLLLHMIESID